MATTFRFRTGALEHARQPFSQQASQWVEVDYPGLLPQGKRRRGVEGQYKGSQL